MATKKTATPEEVISIPKIDLRYATFTIIGDSPLIMHKWSQKAKQEILDKQTKKAKAKGHDAKVPVADFIDSMYWLSGEPAEKTEDGFFEAIENGATFGFPATAIKAAAVSAGYRAGVLKNKTIANGAFHIDNEFVQIDGTPRMREDMVRVGMGVADIRYRGEFPEWSATFTVKYNAGVISLTQLANLINLGGFACGIGEWRAEKGGTFGSYHLMDTTEAEEAGEKEAGEN